MALLALAGAPSVTNADFEIMLSTEGLRTKAEFALQSGSAIEIQHKKICSY